MLYLLILQPPYDVGDTHFTQKREHSQYKFFRDLIVMVGLIPKPLLFLPQDPSPFG